MGQLDFAPNTNVRPTTLNPVILLRDGNQVSELMRWGLVPYWVNNPKAITNCFNARSGSAYQKPMFRGSFKNKRCLVPASAFYEWTHVPGTPRKVKYRISRSDGDLVALAGLGLAGTARIKK